VAAAAQFYRSAAINMTEIRFYQNALMTIRGTIRYYIAEYRGRRAAEDSKWKACCLKNIQSTLRYKKTIWEWLHKAAEQGAEPDTTGGAKNQL
jgi:hypothetical protein